VIRRTFVVSEVFKNSSGPSKKISFSGEAVALNSLIAVVSKRPDLRLVADSRNSLSRSSLVT
jgi:hypothetical protein